ncbi:MAG: hypothetical protein HDT40_02515 [Lachnospiraceae bacterium]|nr:hypothetical protein [Lachnospiraceae bacterium]
MKKNTFKKRIIATMMAMFMAVSMVCIKADAKTAGTGIRESITAYTLYVRENENTNLLGTMRMTIHSSYVQNEFTAAKACGYTTVSVSNNGIDFISGAKPNLSAGDFCGAVKYANNPSKVYGACTVDY